MNTFVQHKQQFQEEQDQLLKTILNYRFFNPWRNITKYSNTLRSLRTDSNLELFITSTCNQKCEYCYLQKYPELYPKEYNQPDLILKNLDILLNYIRLNDYDIPSVSLFTGDIWTTKFGWDVLEKIYQHLLLGLKFRSIIMPSNCSFVNDAIAVQKMQQYIDKFKKIKCPIIISISIDGKIIDSKIRPRNNSNDSYTDEFYSRVGAFARYNDFLFHPMVSPSNVKYWKENYEWWSEYLKYYGYDLDAIMMLEVRDANWTEENIQDYCDYLEFVMEKYLQEMYDNDINKFIRELLYTLDKAELVHKGYTPWLIGGTHDYINCTISNHLTVRLGDLAICPCHRTAYQQYLYGKFVVEDDNIIDIKAINPSMAIKIYMANTMIANPLCDKCLLNPICLKGCIGSQIESGKDPFFPLKNVCDLFYAKTKTIFNFYRKHGVIDYMQKHGNEEYFNDEIATVLRINDQLGD